MSFESIPPEAVGLRLCRIQGERLLLCEGVKFTAGRSAVITTLLRGQISGRVEADGEIKDHFVDVLDAEGNLIDTLALDPNSYRALKNRWMKCKLESDQ